MPTIDFNNLVDDDGSNTVGTVMDRAELQTLLMGAGVNSTVTGAVNSWAPGLAGHTFITWAGAADATFSGIAGGRLGQRVTVRNTGTKVAYFLHQSGLSTAIYRLSNCATSGPTPIAPGGSLIYQYDGASWLLVKHEQGAWITPTYVAGDYTAVGAMTWTVDSGDVEVCRFQLRGNTLHFELSLLGTTVGGTLNTVLRRVVPGGFSATRETRGFFQNNDGGVYAQAQMEIPTAALTRMDFYRNLAGSGNWAAATNALHVFGLQLTIEVT